MVIHVVAALIARGGKVLLAKRNPGGAHGDLWEFPGGKVEKGESESEALARELAEELGIVAEVGVRLGEVTHSYPHVTVKLVLYDCLIIEGEPKPLDCAEVRWVERNEVIGFEMPEADEPLVARYVVERKAMEQG